MRSAAHRRRSRSTAIEAGCAPANAIYNLTPGDKIDLKGIGLAPGTALAAAATLTVHGSTATETLNLDTRQDLSSFDFAISSDGHGGTLLTAQAIPELTDTTSTGSAFVRAGQKVTFTLTTDQAVTVATGTKLTLSNGATALYAGNGAASSTNTFVYTVGSGDAVTADLQVNGYTGSIVDQSAQVLDPSFVAKDTGVDVYKTGVSFTVSTEDQLNSVIKAINAGGPLSQANAAYTISLSGDVALPTALDAIHLASGDTLTINGAGHTISGPAAAFVVYGGGVTYQDLNMSSPQAFNDSGDNFSWISASAGQTVTISGSISGIYGFRPNGQGTVVLSGANTFVGPMGLLSGILDIANAAAAGQNDIDFDVAGAELAIEAGDAPANAINQLAAGDKIDLRGIGLASGSTLAATATLTVHGPTSTETIHLDTRQDFSSFDFAISSDGQGGTLLTVQEIAPTPRVQSLTAAPSIPPYGAGYFETAGQSVAFTLTTNEAVTVAAGTRLTLSNGATAVYQGNGSASASNTFKYLIGAADDIARDLQVTGYTGAITDQGGQTLDPSGVTEDTGVTIYSGTTSFSVSDRDQLATVFHTIDLEGALSQPSTAYHIALAAPITGGGIDSMNLDNSDSLLIDGGGETINFTSGGALTIAGGAVTLENLNLAGAASLLIAGGPRATLEATAGQAMTISGSIADLYGPGPGVAVVGPGTVVLAGASTFAGGIGLQSGVLDLANASAAGSGEIVFTGASATLSIEAGDAPANLIGGLAAGDMIDLKGIGLAAGGARAAAPTLTVTGSSSAVTLNLDPGQNFSAFEFGISSDGAGGTLLTTQSIPAATVAQYEAKIAQSKAMPGRFKVVDTAAHIQAGLSTLEATAGYLAAVRAVDAGLSLDLAQALALQKSNLEITVPVGAAFVVQGLAVNIEALTAAQISGLAAIGATSLVSKNASISFTADQTAALKASGLVVSAAGNFTVTENTAHGYSIYRGGQMIQQKFILPNGACEIAHFNITGKPYSFYENIFEASGQRAATAFDMAGGSFSLQLDAPGLKFTAATSNALYVSSHNFNVHHRASEHVYAHWLKNETFVLSAGFGHLGISALAIKGPGHGVIDLAVSMFSYLKAGMTQAQDLAAVLNHATASGGTLVITDTTAAHDMLSLVGVTADMLSTNPGDIIFVGAKPAGRAVEALARSGRSAAAAIVPSAARFVAAMSAFAPSALSSHELPVWRPVPQATLLHASGRTPL